MRGIFLVLGVLVAISTPAAYACDDNEPVCIVPIRINVEKRLFGGCTATAPDRVELPKGVQNRPTWLVFVLASPDDVRFKNLVRFQNGDQQTDWKDAFDDPKGVSNNWMIRVRHKYRANAKDKEKFKYSFEVDGCSVQPASPILVHNTN